MNSTSIFKDVQKIKERSPLVHNITNYVVMNNTANALLALGASPVMAHSVNEVEDMVSFASSLVINIGTLSEHWITSMIKAGKAAKAKGIPIILDPVGVGATPYRTQTAIKIIAECKPSVIRGNASEIMALVDASITTKGVDSTVGSNKALSSAQQLAIEADAIVVISGPTDYITDGKQVNQIHNGNALMAKVTGMGCTATSVVGAFAGVNSNMLEAATHAMAVMGICGEMAIKKSMGPGTLQLHFLDELYNLTLQDLNTLNHTNTII